MFAFLKEHAYWKDHLYALVVVFVVVALVGDAISAFELARVPCGNNDFVRVALAFFIDPYQAFNRAVAYLVKDDSVLCVAVNIGHVDTCRLAHT